MAHLIDKDALVAKITAFKEDAYRTWKWDTFHTLKELLSFIDTLEVKEIGVDVGSPEDDLGREVVQVIDADGNISDVIINKAQKGEKV